MGCYGQPPQYHINILPCIPDCDTTVSYDDMVDYVISVASGITVSGVRIEGRGDIEVTTQSGIVYVDGTHLIAEDGDIVDGGTL